jgi:hypothetical protein
MAGINLRDLGGRDQPQRFTNSQARLYDVVLHVNSICYSNSEADLFKQSKLNSCIGADDLSISLYTLHFRCRCMLSLFIFICFRTLSRMEILTVIDTPICMI